MTDVGEVGDVGWGGLVAVDLFAGFMQEKDAILLKLDNGELSLIG